MMLPRNRINRPARRSHLWTGSAGIDFVRCRICGDRRRIINGRHLSKHAIDRETYMEEFGLSPDELAAKDWRSIRSSRNGYQPYDRREWIAALKRIYKMEGHVSTKYLQRKYPLIYEQSLWIFGNWDKALRAAGLNPKTTRIRIVWDREKVIKGIQRFQKRSLPLYAQCVMKNDSALFHARLAAAKWLVLGFLGFCGWGVFSERLF